MGGPSFFLKIKYEKQLGRDLAAQIVATPGHEKILSCLQCGTCGSGRPVSLYADYTPRRRETGRASRRRLRHNRCPSARNHAEEPEERSPES